MKAHKTRKRTKKKEEIPAVREVMDIKSLASYLGLGKSKIYALIRQKKIPASRIGRQYRFSKEVIDQWLKEKLITHPEENQMSLFQAETRNEIPAKQHSNEVSSVSSFRAKTEMDHPLA